MQLHGLRYQEIGAAKNEDGSVRIVMNEGQFMMKSALLLVKALSKTLLLKSGTSFLCKAQTRKHIENN